MTINTQRVLLHDTLIGMLSFKQGVCEFKLVESYKRAYPRLVLGQQFLDDLEQVHLSRSGVAPPWFSNLLPEAESPLRKLLVKQAGINSNQDFFLLHYLGEDLPGAVRIIAEDDVIEPDSDEELKDEGEGQSETWSVRFSLAGMQPKFSVLRGERGFTLPVNGLGGKWIVKLPSPNFPKVPENEYATMLWAKASGISVPDLELVEVKDIAGLPTAARDFPDNLALAVRRFDRLEQNRRVHMEDFAQILGLYPHEKYSRNYETLANLILSMTGEAGLDAFIHQLVFVIISGNNDAHQKNWSLIYPNGVSAELSPAYDLVSTIQWRSERRKVIITLQKLPN